MMNFNVNIPRDNLRCMICNLVNHENDPIYPNYSRNKFKYREFLEEIPEAMAAPEDLNAGFIYVIVAKDLFESPDFQDHCTARGIEIVEKVDPILNSIYERCLLNTVEYKLEPQWNKVGQYLVEGPNFLSSIGNIIGNAIELNIDIRNNNVQFTVKPLSLDLPFLRQANRDFQLPYSVKVLPSLADARVVRRWEAIQEEHPFEDYKDLREYWRKMHGYILPNYEEGLLFYDVQFLESEPSTYIYPETCLISRQQIFPLKPISFENYFFVNMAIGIYRRFVENLRERVPTLCGQQLVYPEV